MTLVSSNDPHKPQRKKAKVENDICLGCGLCLKECNKNAIELKPRKNKVITPVNSMVNAFFDFEALSDFTASSRQNQEGSDSRHIFEPSSL